MNGVFCSLNNREQKGVEEEGEKQVGWKFPPSPSHSALAKEAMLKKG